MNDAIEKILATCLERMEAGDSLDSCLSDFPKQAAELKPLLQMTQQMKNLTNVEPRPAFAQNARLHLENQLVVPQKAVTFNRLHRHIDQHLKPRFERRFQMGVLQFIVAAVLTLTATTGGVVYAANASNPGDALHGLELAMENARLNLTTNVSSKVQLRVAFANERLSEAETTFSKNDVANGLEAVNEYGTQISAITQLVGNANGTDQTSLTSLVESAQGIHKDVLTKLLAKAPGQAKGPIQKALDVSNAPIGNPNGGAGNTSNGNSNNNPNAAGNNSHSNGNSNIVGTPVNPHGKP
jgi:hypothetical protein